MKRIIGRIFVIAVTAIALVSGCKCNGIDPDDLSYDKVLILYSAGFNSLSSYLSEDIKDLQKGYVPGERDKNALIVVSHLPQTRGDYITETNVQLIRLISSKKTGVIMDTVATYPSSVNLANPADFRQILTDIKDKFKSDHYGMIFSSHASGWLPAGYYSNADYFEPNFSGGARRAPAHVNLPHGAVPYVEPEEFPGAPAVKSIGMSNSRAGGEKISYEIELPDLAASIPMHLDYFILDACLSGGIEVAYQMKDVCDVIAFSQAEVLAEGLVYENVSAHLLADSPDVVSVARDYFEHYASQSDVSDRSATISVVDCRKLDEIATVCKSLFSEYRSRISSVDPSRVQCYYRSDHHWFYDLEDILVKAGISASEQSRLETALDHCILYKAASDAFLEYFGGFKIDAFSGFSMYLPANGTAYLNNYYKTLEWNKATELVD